ncbi:hypothetical protein H5410_057607 [Solanum commersonii]|uniref:Uncharacterized protein n=1 Tax=Solanum commersonii TaxID=4109 RepID=A0A9J5WNK0_SOLCO|nr:hypothetical protein H5410_057607 [Solanum commersonii]
MMKLEEIKCRTLGATIPYTYYWQQQSSFFSIITYYKWRDSKKGSVGMTVKKNILYADFMNLVVHNCGLNCQPKDLVISYIHNFFHNEKVLPFKITDQPSLLIYVGEAVRPILRVNLVENPIEENHKQEEDQHDMLNDKFDVWT